MSQPLIILVEDETSIAETLIYALETENFTVKHATTGKGGLEMFRAHPGASVVILDLGLPDVSGFDVCRQIRQLSNVPVLILTARDSEIDEVLGLELGADDYVTKPFSPRSVVARIRSLIRRQQGTSSEVRSSECLSHDEPGKRFMISGEAVPLTTHEYLLLLALVSNSGRVLSRDQLLHKAWEDPYSTTDRVVDAHVKTIRAKLRAISEPSADCLQTRRGLGYVYEPAPHP